MDKKIELVRAKADLARSRSALWAERNKAIALLIAAIYCFSETFHRISHLIT